jgi:hypothetical protein
LPRQVAKAGADTDAVILTDYVESGIDRGRRVIAEGSEAEPAGRARLLSPPRARTEKQETDGEERATHSISVDRWRASGNLFEARPIVLRLLGRKPSRRVTPRLGSIVASIEDMKHVRTSLLALSAIILSSSLALAGSSFSSLYRTFRGKLLVSDQQLVDPVNCSTTKAVKKRALKELVAEDVDGVATWTFHYAAFLSRAPKTSEVSIDFHKLDREQTYVGNVVLAVDPSTTILIGELEFDEDVGPCPNTTYDVVIRTRGLKKERDLAKARITLR